jgi:hypothetical protein
MIFVVAFLMHRLGGKPAFKGEGVLPWHLTTRAHAARAKQDQKESTRYAGKDWVK